MKLSTRLTIAIVALVVVTAGTVGLLTYRNISAVALPRTLARADAHVRGVASDLTNIVDGAVADLKGFRLSIGLLEIVTLSSDPSPEARLKLEDWRSRFARRLAAELEAKPNYIQYRIIGIADGGREILRVDHQLPDGSLRVVPEAELQRKGDRDYFKQTLQAPKGAVVISKLELNQEWGKIEIPRVPTVSISTAIYSPEGQPFGILVINIDLRPAFKHIEQTTEPGTAVYLVNDRGDYLLHPDESRAFGFEFGTPYRLQDDFPTLAKAVDTGVQVPELIATALAANASASPSLRCGSAATARACRFSNRPPKTISEPS